MHTTIIIPAGQGSAKLLLLAESGKPLLQHTWEKVRGANLPGRIVIATDSAEIATAVSGFGGGVAWVGPSATDSHRVAQAGRYWPSDLIVQTPGNEPDVDPGVLDCVIARAQHLHMPVTTLATTAVRGDQCRHRVVVHEDRALYFSQMLLPGSICHLPIYAHHASFLDAIREGRLRAASVAELERSEPLLWLANGYPVAVLQTSSCWGGVNTKADYDRFLNSIRRA